MGNRSAWRKKAIELCLTAALIGVAGGAAASLAGFLGSLWWVFDLCAHFRLQYLLVGGACAAVMIAARRWWTLPLGAFVVVSNGAVIAPLVFASQPAARAAAVPLELVSFNVHRANPNHDAVGRYLGDADADILVVLEVTPAALTELTARFPDHARVAESRNDSFGMALFSRLPLRTQRRLHLGASDLPAIEVSFEHGGERYALLAIHPMPPTNRDNSHDRDAVLVEAARWARAQPDHAIVVGDFNATPWSHAFRELLADGELQSSQRGFGVQTSWPGELWPMSIPIDHLVHSASLTTLRRSVGPFLGSDHRPLHVTVAPR